MNDTSQKTPALQLENVLRTYVQGENQLEILKGVNFAIWPGQSVALIAPSNEEIHASAYCGPLGNAGFWRSLYRNPTHSPYGG